MRRSCYQPLRNGRQAKGGVAFGRQGVTCENFIADSHKCHLEVGMSVLLVVSGDQ